MGFSEFALCEARPDAMLKSGRNLTRRIRDESQDRARVIVNVEVKEGGVVWPA